MVVFGVPEAKSETQDELKEEVIGNVFHKQLGVKVTSVGRIHRRGKCMKETDSSENESGGGERKTLPVIFYFHDPNE